MDGPTSQAILKIIQLECDDMSDPFEIVDLCIHWKNSWRRSKVFWEGLLEQTCERLGVDIPNDRTEALVPENMLLYCTVRCRTLCPRYDRKALNHLLVLFLPIDFLILLSNNVKE